MIRGISEKTIKYFHIFAFVDNFDYLSLLSNILGFFLTCLNNFAFFAFPNKMGKKVVTENLRKM